MYIVTINSLSKTTNSAAKLNPIDIINSNVSCNPVDDHFEFECCDSAMDFIKIYKNRYINYKCSKTFDNQFQHTIYYVELLKYDQYENIEIIDGFYPSAD